MEVSRRMDRAHVCPDVAALRGTAAAEAGDRLAVVEAGGRGMTWAELDVEVSRVASGLGAAGIVAGHRVMLALGNRLEFVTAYLGVLRAQAVAVPVNPPRPPPASSPGCSPTRAPGWSSPTPTPSGAVREAVAAVQGTTGDSSADLLDGRRRGSSWSAGAATSSRTTHLRAAEPREVPPLPDPEKLAVLLYTSGTSGRRAR